MVVAPHVAGWASPSPLDGAQGGRRVAMLLRRVLRARHREEFGVWVTFLESE